MLSNLADTVEPLTKCLLCHMGISCLMTHLWKECIEGKSSTKKEWNSFVLLLWEIGLKSSDNINSFDSYQLRIHSWAGNWNHSPRLSTLTHHPFSTELSVRTTSGKHTFPPPNSSLFLFSFQTLIMQKVPSTDQLWAILPLRQSSAKKLLVLHFFSVIPLFSLDWWNSTVTNFLRAFWDPHVLPTTLL